MPTVQLNADSAVQVLASGGGLRIRASTYVANTLFVMAEAAAKSGATLIIINDSGLHADSIFKIGQAGKGRVIFDMTQ